MKKTINVVAAFLLLVAPATVWAGGEVRVDGLGPEALGRGGVGNGWLRDQKVSGAAVYYNVAQFGLLEGSLWQTEIDTVIPRFSYEPSAGVRQDSRDQIFVLPEMVFATKVKDRNLVLYSGIYSPFGLGALNRENWRTGLGFRKSRIGLINFTWGLATRIDDEWTIGAGLDVGYGQLKYGAGFHQIGNVILSPIYAEVEDSGTGLGGRIGLQYTGERIAGGLSLSLPERICLNGHTGINLWNLELGRDHNDTSYTFPGRLGAGLMVKVTGRLSLGADLNYYFGRNDGLKLNHQVLPTIWQKTDWQNNWSAHLGGEYQLNDRTVLRAGLAYLTNAVPEETVNPIIPDYRHGYGAGAGLGWQITKSPENDKAKPKAVWTLDLAYNYSWADTRHVSRSRENISPGDYDFSGHVFSAGITCRF